MAVIATEDYRYFLYSKSYMEDRNKVEDKIGKEYVTGTVTVNGEIKEFSILSKTPTLQRYSDIRIIAEGDINKMKYVKPYAKPKRS